MVIYGFDKIHPLKHLLVFVIKEDCGDGTDGFKGHRRGELQHPKFTLNHIQSHFDYWLMSKTKIISVFKLESITAASKSILYPQHSLLDHELVSCFVYSVNYPQHSLLESSKISQKNLFKLELGSLSLKSIHYPLLE